MYIDTSDKAVLKVFEGVANPERIDGVRISLDTDLLKSDAVVTVERGDIEFSIRWPNPTKDHHFGALEMNASASAIAVLLERCLEKQVTTTTTWKKRKD